MDVLLRLEQLLMQFGGLTAVNNFSLTLRAGERPLATWEPTTPRHWERIELGPFPWQPGEALVFAVSGPAGEPTNGLILDRARLAWR